VTRRGDTIVRKIRQRSERGNVAAEVALALPVLLFALLGIVDMGRGVAAKAALGSAARAATRYAAVRSVTSGDPATADKIRAYLRGNVSGGIDPDLIQINAVWEPTNTRGSMVQVSVNYDFVPVMPFIPIHSIALSSSSESIISN